MVSVLKIPSRFVRARLELLRQADVNKATGRVIGEICVVRRGVRVGRILAENIVAAVKVNKSVLRITRTLL